MIPEVTRARWLREQVQHAMQGVIRARDGLPFAPSAAQIVASADRIRAAIWRAHFWQRRLDLEMTRLEKLASTPKVRKAPPVPKPAEQPGTKRPGRRRKKDGG